MDPEAVDEDTGAESSFNLSKEEEELWQRLYGPRIQYSKIHCTSCNLHLGSALEAQSNRFVHPLLKVLICKECYHFYKRCGFDKDKDGSELYCRWCGHPGRVFCCSKCPFVFCSNCIQNNFGRKKMFEIRDSDSWDCFRCSPNQIITQRVSCYEFFEYIRREMARTIGNPEIWRKDYSQCCPVLQPPHQTQPKWFETAVKETAELNSHLSYTLVTLTQAPEAADAFDQLQDLLSSSIDSLMLIRENIRTQFIASSSKTRRLPCKNTFESEPVPSLVAKMTSQSPRLNVKSVPKNQKVSSKSINIWDDTTKLRRALLEVFHHLDVPDLLRARCVCTMWRDVASHPSLWKQVRIKKNQVHSFEGLANNLQKNGTVHLDLRKMLLPTNDEDEMWAKFSRAIRKVHTLREIALCRCPASVVEHLAYTNKDLKVINAGTIKCKSISLDMFSSFKNLEVLKLKSTNGLILASDITSLKELTNLTHLSLTSVKDLNKVSLSVIAALRNLESLDLGDCTNFPANFGKEILIKLKKLEKLRLEKVQGNCHTLELLDAVKNMPQLEQLKLVDFDIKISISFYKAIAGLNIRKLLITPTHLISVSATTNHMVMGAVLGIDTDYR